MSYLYPEALNGIERAAHDLIVQAMKLGKYPKKTVIVRCEPDASTGTASVNWDDWSSPNYLTVTIRMPVLPATHRMSEAEYQDWIAYVYHEIGHPLHTSKTVWDGAVRTGRHVLLNSLDDVRTEKASNDWGIAVNGKQALTDLVAKLHAKAEATGYNPNDPVNIGWTLSYLGRAHCNGYAIDTMGIAKALDANGPVAKVVTWAIPALGACQSTQDCLDLADRIVAALPKQAPKPKPTAPDMPTNPGKSGQGKAASEQEADSEAGEASQGQEPSSEAGEAKEGQEPSSEAGKAASEQEADSAAGEAADGQEPSSEAGEAKEGESGQAGDGTSGPGGKTSDQSKPLEHADIKDWSMQPKPKDALPNTRKTQRVAQVIEAIRGALKARARKHALTRNAQGDQLAALAAKATRQRALLARALKAPDSDEYDRGRSRGRLDRHAFGRLAAGSTAVFGKRIITEGYETDLVILIDGSSSMAGAPARIAVELALVIAQAASQVGIDCHAYIFNGNAGLHELTKGRQRPLAGRFAGALDCVIGGTPLCPSLLRVAIEQSKRAATKRRVVFALTDGQCNQGIDAMVATVAYMEKAMGIEVANLMIGQPVTGAFRNEVSVPLGRQVCEVGLDQLTRQLERGAAA